MQRTISAIIKERSPEISFAAGTAVLLEAVARTTPTHAIAGVAAMLLGAIAKALRIVEQNIRDTSRERDRLHAEEQAAQAVHMQYVTARALVDREAENLCEQMAKVERELDQRLADELERLTAKAEADREELLAELEDHKSALKAAAWFSGYDAGQRGILLEPARPTGGAVVIPLPLPPIGSDATTGADGSLS